MPVRAVRPRSPGQVGLTRGQCPRSGVRDHQARVAVGPLLLEPPALGERDRVARLRPFDHDGRAGGEPGGRASAASTSVDLGRSACRTAGRGTRRRTAPPAAPPARNDAAVDALEARDVSNPTDSRFARIARCAAMSWSTSTARAAPPRQRFDGERATARVEVEHARIGGAVPPSDANSASFSRSVVGRASPLRRDQPPPTDRSRDHPQRHGQTLRGRSRNRS